MEEKRKRKKRRNLSNEVPKFDSTDNAKRTPIATDFGTYLKALRVHKGITRKKLGAGIGLSYSSIRNIEDGWNLPPTPERLRLWLSLIGESKRYGEATRLLRSIKNIRTFHYYPRNPANEHIDRLLDAYEKGKLTLPDLRLLQMIAPREYV